MVEIETDGNGGSNRLIRRLRRISDGEVGIVETGEGKAVSVDLFATDVLEKSVVVINREDNSVEYGQLRTPRISIGRGLSSPEELENVLLGVISDVLGDIELESNVHIDGVRGNKAGVRVEESRDDGENVCWGHVAFGDIDNSDTGDLVYKLKTVIDQRFME